MPQTLTAAVFKADGESICFALGRRRKPGSFSSLARPGCEFRLADISAVTKNKKIHQGRGGPGATYGNTRGS